MARVPPGSAIHIIMSSVSSSAFFIPSCGPPESTTESHVPVFRLQPSVSVFSPTVISPPALSPVVAMAASQLWA